MAYTDPTVDLSTPTSSTAANTAPALIIRAARFFKERWADMTGCDPDVDPNVPTKYGTKIAINTSQVRATAEFDNGNCITTKNLSFDNGNFQKATQTGACQFSFTNIRIGATMQLRLLNSATALFIGVKWSGGLQPTPSGSMVYTFYSPDGTIVIGGVFVSNYS